MGRDEYLWRLCLGRSAFRPLESAQKPVQAQQEERVAADQRSGAGSKQLYDDKGRPCNPAKDRMDAAIRYAQNEVLAFSGVVQRTRPWLKSDTPNDLIQQPAENTTERTEWSGQSLLPYIFVFGLVGLISSQRR